MQIEGKRRKLQDQLDSLKLPMERNVLGQFATPFSFAKSILEQTRKYLGNTETISFLDPAFGTGAFYSALIQTFHQNKIKKAYGIEIDLHYAKYTQKFWQDFPLKIIIADFLSLMPPNMPNDKYKLIICNPPYVRHHHVAKDRKQNLQKWVKYNFGYKISGLAGLYCYFILHSDKWLAVNGLSCWLIPGEFLDVNYGYTLKQYFSENVTLLRIHKFQPKDVQFKDALVTSVVVWFIKKKPSPENKIVFSYGGNLAIPQSERTYKLAEIDVSKKWSNYFLNEQKQKKCVATLGDYFQIKRGIATGNNKFFILSMEEIEERNLPNEFFLPILPSPRNIKTYIIESLANGLPDINNPLFLLNCDLGEEEIKNKYHSLWDYISQGIGSVSERYICKNRTPWYRQERRLPAPFLCTYMGRNMNSRAKPFRFILNKSKAVAANVYLLLYPKPLLAKIIEQDHSIGEKVLNVLNNLDLDLLVKNGRVYGGGLYKLEPKELTNIPISEFGDITPKLKVKKIIQKTLF